MVVISEVNTLDEQPAVACRHVGRSAVVWKHGFRTGAIDALQRLASKPQSDMLATLNELLSEYANDNS